MAARRLGMRVAAALALDGVGNGDGPILVHLDVDVIDAAEMPAKQFLTPGTGLAYAEVSDLVTAIVASPRVIALEVTEYDPSRDPTGEHARKIVDLIVARRAAASRAERGAAPRLPPVGAQRILAASLQEEHVLRQTLALSLAASLSFLPRPRQPATADADVLRGIRQVEDGDYDPAIVTLDAAARRLGGDPAHARDLSQAYLYLVSRTSARATRRRRRRSSAKPSPRSRTSRSARTSSRPRSSTSSRPRARKSGRK
jgi:hypothetical protein